jgi:hypothetical protein
MKSIFALLFFGLASASALTLTDGTNAEDIFEVGPFTVQHKLYLSLFTWGLDHSVDVWAPQGEGNFPVIYFIPGIAGSFINFPNT